MPGMLRALGPGVVFMALAQGSGKLIFLLLLTLITGVTVKMNDPGTLILISAVIGFVGTVIYFSRADFAESRLPAAPTAQRGQAG